MQFAEVAATSVTLAATKGRKAKVATIAALLKQTGPGERALAARWLGGEIGHKLGVGYGIVGELRGSVPAATAPELSLIEVDRRVSALVGLAGAGSTLARKEVLGRLLAQMTAVEQGYFAALLIGEIRQGALDALVVDAVALATGLEAKAVRTAYMLAGELGMVAETVLAHGAAGLATFGLTLGRPILPMLAQTADSAEAALAEHAGAPLSFEWKLDGFRVQIHKDGDTIRVFSRAMNDVTASVPEVVAAARALAPRCLILDGESLAYREDGRPLPFQDTMARKTIGGAPGALTLSVFDILLVEDETLLSTPAHERFALIARLAPAHAVPRIITADAAEATAFYDAAVTFGHEGVMAKALAAHYDAGARGAAWMKIKRIHRLDLVVLAAEWGSGRRKGWLSNLHLGARDPATGGYVMLGKTFKGMTDETLAWQTAELLAREVDRDRHIVLVRPELVAELAFNDVLRSSQYPGGLALRHARLVRYRPDKTVAEADTIETVRALAVADGVLPASSR